MDGRGPFIFPQYFLDFLSVNGEHPRSPGKTDQTLLHYRNTNLTFAVGYHPIYAKLINLKLKQLARLPILRILMFRRGNKGIFT